MSVPEKVRNDLRTKLWAIADGLDWTSVSVAVKSRHYEAWAKDPEIRGVLGRYVALPKVRLYLKDSLLKDYGRVRSGDGARPLQAAGIPAGAKVAATYIKPHGVRLADGKVICWGRAGAWKDLVMAIHERCFDLNGVTPHAVVLTNSVGDFKQERTRRVVEAAARKLGLARVVWLES